MHVLTSKGSQEAEQFVTDRKSMKEINTINPKHLLIQYLYEGLCGRNHVMLDVASEGAFMDKTTTNGKALLKNIAGNT
ncbi:unnamed protein product [Malus baccata var. baccata]